MKLTLINLLRFENIIRLGYEHLKNYIQGYEMGIIFQNYMPLGIHLNIKVY